jgi:SEC-C motif
MQGDSYQPKKMAERVPRIRNRQTGPPQEPGRNDPCLCPSGRKYKLCCQRVKDEIRSGPEKYAPYSVRSLVLEEIRSFKDIFDVKMTDTEVKVRGKVTDSDVVLFVERVRNLWGSKHDLLSYMPKKGDLKFRALYFGSPDMLSTVNLLARYSLYCDQIIVIDPFSMFHEMSRKFKHSPFQEPQAWVRQIIRSGVYLASLEEWIRNDLVFATTFPLSFHDPLRKKHVQGMKDRLENFSPEKWDEIIQDTVASQFYSQYTPNELSAMAQRKLR